MNRRQFAASAIGALAIPVAAQELGGTNYTYPLAEQPPHVIPPAERKKQYEICKQRGHVRTIEGNLSYYVSPSVFTIIPDGPAQPNRGATTPWGTCWYCGTAWRYVTTMEEREKP